MCLLLCEFCRMLISEPINFQFDSDFMIILEIVFILVTLFSHFVYN